MLEKLPDAVGEALSDLRAGLDNCLFRAVDLGPGTAAITVSSLSFVDHGPLPAQYTADGTGTSPALQWNGVPSAATDVVLVVEDADSPTPNPLVHAIAHLLSDIPAAADGALAEGALDALGDDAPALVALGRNSLMQTGWLPPDPPPGHGQHRYAFQIFALGPGDPLPEVPGRDAVRQALVDRGLASGWAIAIYERPSGTIPEPLTRTRRATDAAPDEDTGQALPGGGLLPA